MSNPKRRGNMAIRSRSRIVLFVSVVAGIFLLNTIETHAQLSGCDYWIDHPLKDIVVRLEKARNEFLSIPSPTKKDLDEEYQIKWNDFKKRGYDPKYQMRVAPKSWLQTGYYYRKYWKITSFVPTEQEVWIFCVDTRQGRGACRNINEKNGNLHFRKDGSAIDAPTEFRKFYEESKQNFFEHFMLAAMVVDALPACDDSAEARRLRDKALQYIHETTRRLWR
jgi:hypothetical protein